MAGAGGFFSADAQPEAAPAAGPGELVQFVTATPAVPAPAYPGEPAPAFGRDDDRWEDDEDDDHQAEARERREDDDDDRGEHEAYEWEAEDD